MIRERAAMEAERAANKYKQVEYMQNFLGDEFEGVISGVSSLVFGWKQLNINARDLLVYTVYLNMMISGMWKLIIVL